MTDEDAEAPAATAADDSDDVQKKDYDYLLSMSLWSLTTEDVEELKKQHEKKTEEVNELKKTTVEQMWERDLKAIADELDEIDAQEEKAAKKQAILRGSGKGRVRAMKE